MEQQIVRYKTRTYLLTRIYRDMILRLLALETRPDLTLATALGLLLDPETAVFRERLALGLAVAVRPDFALEAEGFGPLPESTTDATALGRPPRNILVLILEFMVCGLHFF